jgi:hypothetical protein
MPYCGCILIPLQAVGRSVGRSVGPLVGWLIGQFVGWSVGWSVVEQSVGPKIRVPRLSEVSIQNDKGSWALGVSFQR